MIAFDTLERPCVEEVAPFCLAIGGQGKKIGWITVERDEPIYAALSRTVAGIEVPSPSIWATMTTTGWVNAAFGPRIIIVQASEEDRAPAMLADIRRLTGWSWDRIGSALEKTRQAIHGWTLGKEIAPANMERLAKFHATLTYIDRGSAEQNRDLLNTATADGRIVADLLDHQEFDPVRELVGAGSALRDASLWAKLADAERVATKEHWFARLAETDGAEAIPEIIAPPDAKRRHVTVRRRG